MIATAAIVDDILSLVLLAVLIGITDRTGADSYVTP
jgi:Kef-type K+ transport system membrane component KefB